MVTQPPIRRHPALADLSRDHHFGLLLTWKIRQGIKKEVPPLRISRYVSYFFEEDLKYHFKEEEEKLFTLLPPADAMRQQAEREHQQIYSLVQAIEKAPNWGSLLQLADALESHIRFEERQLFNHLQQTLQPHQLEAIAMHDSYRKGDVDARWEDPFWEIY